MKRSRTIAGALFATIVVGATLASTAATANAAGSNSGHAVVGGHATLNGSVSPNASRTVINRPNKLYVGHTCKFDLSGIADGTTVTSLDQCGITVTFSPSVIKASVPNSWGTWGSPPDTETATPDILTTNGADSVTISFSAPVRLSGAEAEPDPFEYHVIQASFYRPSGGMKTSVARNITGDGGARLLAMKTKNIGSIVLSSDTDFAFANLRVNLMS